MKTAPSPASDIVSEPLKMTVDITSQPLDPRLVGPGGPVTKDLDLRRVSLSSSESADTCSDLSSQ